MPHELLHREKFDHFPVKQTLVNDSANKVISIYKGQIDSQMQTTIVTAKDAFTKEKEQHALGNFVCDAMKQIGEKELKQTCDVVIINRGGLRATLPKGEIKVMNIFELMPFDNEMVLLTISGQKLLEGLKTILEKKHSYLGLTIKTNLKNELLEVKINGEKLNENQSYKILTSDYLANGGDRFDFFKGPHKKENSGIKIRDAIIAYCVDLNVNGKILIPYTDERLQISE